MAPNAKLPGWVKTVLSRRENIERALGLPIGEPLGCGHWGCVFRSEGPWVVKLTRDPTEGPIWARLREWYADAPCCTDGIVRIKDIVRLQPDLKFGRRTWPIHAIVREEAVPVLESHGRLSPYTLEKIHVPSEEGTPHGSTLDITLDRMKRRGLQTDDLEDLHDLFRGLLKFREDAEAWNREAKKRRPNLRSLDNYKDAALRATNPMRGRVGGAIGETLSQLLGDDIVLQDVHWGNIGWRVHPVIGNDEAMETVVIFDPGHTPTEPREDIRELAPNARREPARGEYPERSLHGTGRHAYAVTTGTQEVIETWVSPHPPNSPEAADDGTDRALRASERLGRDDLGWEYLGEQW